MEVTRNIEHFSSYDKFTKNIIKFSRVLWFLFSHFSWQFLGIFPEVSGDMGLGPVTKSDIVKRQIKTFTIGLQKTNPEIIYRIHMLNIWENVNSIQCIHIILPTGFTILFSRITKLKLKIISKNHWMIDLGTVHTKNIIK